MRIVREPEEIDGLRVVQDEKEIAKALKNGETVLHWELGDSMAPLINNAEYCKIMPIKNVDDVKRGDAVFCKMEDGYYMVHQVWEISDCGHDGKKWFKIGSTMSTIFGWTQNVLGIAKGTNIFQCKEVCERVIAEYERQRLEKMYNSEEYVEKYI